MTPSPAKPIVVFISSPGDLASERDRLDGAIRDVAARFAPHGLHLTSWRWDRDAVPGVAESAQTVVDQQVPRDYDIYAGVMCRRFGTPTLTAESGTADEFLKAVRRSEQTGSPAIAFYFCEGAQRPGPIRAAQQGCGVHAPLPRAVPDV